MKAPKPIADMDDRDWPSGQEEQDEQAAAESKKSSTPLGVPWLQPEDVAPVVVFLASDGAKMVTGSVYDVTGGESANYTP